METKSNESLIDWRELAEKYPSVLRDQIARMKESISIMEQAMGDAATRKDEGACRDNSYTAADRNLTSPASNIEQPLIVGDHFISQGEASEISVIDEDALRKKVIGELVYSFEASTYDAENISWQIMGIFRPHLATRKPVSVNRCACEFDENHKITEWCKFHGDLLNKKTSEQPVELTVDIDATYPLVAEEWTYLPASKDEWCRVLKTIAKAWGLKCQE